MKISVIIPTYNRCKIVCEAIDSVLAQTYPVYEIIVVDDGSKDNTKSFIRKKYCSKIRYIYQKNMGPAAARNLGIKKSKGDWIAFLDADDLWEKNKIEKQVIYLIKLNNDSIGLIDTFAKITNFSGRIKGFTNKIKNGDCFTQMLYLNVINTTSSVLINKKVFKKVGFLNEKFRGVEDHEFWLRLAAEFKIYTVPHFLTIYRTHDGNISSNVEFMEKYCREFMKTAFKNYADRIKPEEKNKILVSNLSYYLGCYFSSDNYARYRKLYVECIQLDLNFMFKDGLKYSILFLRSFLSVSFNKFIRTRYVGKKNVNEK